MKIPEGYTEQEVVDIIDRVVNRIAHKFKFGYHTIDDMKQYGRMEAIMGIEKDYNPDLPLENFLYSHVHNRLFNIKRNQFKRPDKPCFKCSLNAYNKEDDSCNAYFEEMECKWYAGWVRRNNAKQNLMQPIELDNVVDEEEHNMKTNDSVADEVTYNEIVNIIDANLPVALRKDWLLCQGDTKLPKHRRQRLQEAVLEILKEHNIDGEDSWQIE